MCLKWEKGVPNFGGDICCWKTVSWKAGYKGTVARMWFVIRLGCEAEVEMELAQVQIQWVAVRTLLWSVSTVDLLLT
jgi:hypothetical protein